MGKWRRHSLSFLPCFWLHSWWEAKADKVLRAKKSIPALLVPSLTQVISCSGHHSQRNCSVNLENVSALRNSFGIKVSNHQKHEKAFRGKIFSFIPCGNNHFKKLRAKTGRWLNFAPSHVSVKEPDLPWPLLGQLDSPGLHSVLSPLGGWQHLRNEEPIDANCFRSQAFGSAVLYH